MTLARLTLLALVSSLGIVEVEAQVRARVHASGFTAPLAKRRFRARTVVATPRRAQCTPGAEPDQPVDRKWP